MRVSSLNFNSDDPYEVNLADINFTLNKGECLGIAGISGNGQNELFQILSGETLSNNGSIKFRSKEISKLNPKERREQITINHEVHACMNSLAKRSECL